MKLITLEDDFPVFNPECRLIREFNAIIVRDKGSKGDAQGRKKSMATKELAYVHFITYYNSEFVTSVSEEERVKAIKKHLDLPDDWKPDEIIELACMTYNELTSTPSMDALREARESLFSANRVIRLLRKRLETKLQELDSQMTGDSEEEMEKKMTELADKTVKDYEKIVSIADKMPNSLDTMNKLEERVKKEMEKESKGRKGRDIDEEQFSE